MSPKLESTQEAEFLTIERKIDQHCRAGKYADAIALSQTYESFAAPESQYAIRALYLRAYVQFLAGHIVDASESIEVVLPRLTSMQVEFKAHALVLATDIFLAAKRWQESARLLSELASTQRQLNQNTTLQSRYMRLLLISQNSHQHVRKVEKFVRRLVAGKMIREAACLLADLSRYYERNGKLPVALRSLNLGISLNCSVPTVQADLLIQAGRHCQMRGELQAACDNYVFAAKAGAGPLQTFEAYVRIALAQWDLNQRQQALHTLESALANVHYQPPELLRPLVSYARSAFGLAHDSAISGLPNEAEVSPAGQVADQEALRRGAEMQAAGLQEDARAWYMQAWRLADQSRNAEVAWRAAVAIGRLMSTLANDSDCGTGEALRWLEKSVEVLEQQSKTIHQPINRTHYRYQLRNIVVDLLESSVKSGSLADTFHYLEMTRGKLLSDYVQSHSKSKSSPVFSSWLGQLSRWFQGINAKQGALNKFRKRLRQDELYASIFLIDNHLAVLAATRDREPWLLSVEVDSTRLSELRQDFLEEVESQLNCYRYGKDVLRYKSKFHDRLLLFANAGPMQLLSQLVETTGKSTWLLSLDSHLAAIPWHALPVGGRLLIEHVDLCYLPYAKLIEELKPTRRIRSRSRGLVVAEDEQVLPSAPIELRSVCTHFPKSIRLSGSEAKLDEIQRWLPKVSFAHFACHAETCTESPLNARILLPSGESWSADNVASLRLMEGSLAVLNCCKTGEQQKLVAGELFSMAAGFLSSGASSVVAALWSLPDEEAAQLIAGFYKLLTQSRAVHALCETQRLALNQGMHPLFWTPFIFMGNPR